MGITAVEHAQVAPRNPVAGCVVDDRYIVTMAYNSSSSGGTGFTDYAVFDPDGHAYAVGDVASYDGVLYPAGWKKV